MASSLRNPDIMRNDSLAELVDQLTLASSDNDGEEEIRNACEENIPDTKTESSQNGHSQTELCLEPGRDADVLSIAAIQSEQSSQAQNNSPEIRAQQEGALLTETGLSSSTDSAFSSADTGCSSVDTVSTSVSTLNIIGGNGNSMEFRLRGIGGQFE